MKKNYNHSKKAIFKNLFVYFLIFTCYVSYSQTLDFTIDTATDNGTSISESIVDGADTYVLTATSVNDAQLDDLGGGDKIFFTNTDVALNPWVITITRNGTQAYFTLNGIDYDTLEAGDISLRNQDDALISNQQTYAFGSGSIIITNASNAIDILSLKIHPHDSDDLNDFAFHNINVTMGNTLGVEDVALNKNIAVYPNPSKGDVMLKNNSDIQLKSLHVSDVNGRILKSVLFNNSFTEKNIDLNNLNTGIYFLTISSENGKSHRKLIIE